MAVGSSQDEVAALRARVAELEAQLAEQQRATAQLVARSQDKLYWLERWHVDLDVVMRRRSAQLALGSLKAVRGLSWRLKRTVRRLRGTG